MVAPLVRDNLINVSKQTFKTINTRITPTHARKTKLNENEN